MGSLPGRHKDGFMTSLNPNPTIESMTLISRLRSTRGDDMHLATEFIGIKPMKTYL